MEKLLQLKQENERLKREIHRLDVLYNERAKSATRSLAFAEKVINYMEYGGCQKDSCKVIRLHQ